MRHRPQFVALPGDADAPMDQARMDRQRQEEVHQRVMQSFARVVRSSLLVTVVGSLSWVVGAPPSAIAALCTMGACALVAALVLGWRQQRRFAAAAQLVTPAAENPAENCKKDAQSALAPRQ